MAQVLKDKCRGAAGWSRPKWSKSNLLGAAKVTRAGIWGVAGGTVPGVVPPVVLTVTVSVTSPTISRVSWMPISRVTERRNVEGRPRGRRTVTSLVRVWLAVGLTVEPTA